MGFTLSNTFIPLLWIGALGATASQGTTALSILFGIGAVCTYFGGMLSDRLGYRTIIRTAFCIMVPAYFLLTNTTNLFLATALLVPCASLYSPDTARWSSWDRPTLEEMQLRLRRTLGLPRIRRHLRAHRTGPPISGASPPPSRSSG